MRSLPPGDKLSITRLASKSPFVPSESPAGDANGESDDEAIIPKHVLNRERKEGFFLYNKYNIIKSNLLVAFAEDDEVYGSYM